MKPVKYIALAMAAVLFASCATTFRPWKLSEVDEGMDRAQVIGILGEPDSVETQEDGAEFMYYSYSENYNPPLSTDTGGFSDNPEQQLRDYQTGRSLKEYRYSVKMVGGKVLSYKELEN